MGFKSKSKANKSSTDVSGSFAANQAANPEKPFAELQNNFNTFRQGQMDSLFGLLGPLMGAGMESMGANPMMEKMGFENPFENVLANFMTNLGAERERQAQPSAYDQRLQALMDGGMTREQAMANQAHAMRLGTDYNRDGAVTNDEWRKYQNSGANNAPAPMHYGSMGGGGAPQFGTWNYAGLNQR